MELHSLAIESSGNIATLRLNEPQGANRIDGRVLRELEAACETIAAEAGVRVVIVEGAGGDFCAGWHEETRRELEAARRVDPFGCLASLPVPVLASMQGSIIDAGLELALACDIRVAAEDALFGLTDVGQGSLPLAGGSQRLPRIAGRTASAAMLLLGEEIDAAAALRCGLVSRLFPVASRAVDTLALAQRIAANGPAALRYAKEAIIKGLELPLDQALRYELDLSVILQTTHDRAEGVRAFLEKDEPNFEGR